MYSATALVAAFAILALGVSVVDTGPGPFDAEAGATRVVAADGSGGFDTIQAAVDAAEDGDTVLIAPGTYTESVVIDKDITVLGDGGPGAVIVHIPDDGPAVQHKWAQIRYGFLLDDADVDLGHLTFRGPARSVAAVMVLGGAPVLHDLVEDFDEYERYPYELVVFTEDAAGTIRDSTAKASLWISDQASPLVEGNVIKGAIASEYASSGRIVDNELGIMWISQSATPTIEGNVFDNAIALQTHGGSLGCGITTDGVPPGPTVSRNVIRNAPMGICAGSATGGHFTANELIDNDLGILSSGSLATFEDNTIRGGSTGISIGHGSPTLKGNTVEGTTNGLVLGPDTTPTLQGNTICGNEKNLVVAIGAEPPDTTGNQICEDAPAT